MTNENELISVAKAAEELQVSERSVTGYITSGRLPAQKFGRRAYAIRRADLELVRDIKKGPPFKADPSPSALSHRKRREKSKKE